MSEARRTRGLQRGARSQRVVDSVQQATIAELARVGFGGLSIERVATLAGVHRSTVYRRWPTREALVAGLFEPGLERMNTLEPSGDLRADLLALARRLSLDLQEPLGRALVRVLGSQVPELTPLLETARSKAMGAFRVVLARGVEAGQLREDTDTEALAYLLFYGVVHGATEGTMSPERLLMALLPPIAPGGTTPPNRDR